MGPVLTVMKVIYAAATALVFLAFLGSGVGYILHARQFSDELRHLGYPPYLLGLLGAWKVLGAVAVVVPGQPRLKEWAYAGMFFDLSGAAASRGFSGDGAAATLAPLVLAVVVLLLWAFRPTDRTLVAWPGFGVARGT